MNKLMKLKPKMNEKNEEINEMKTKLKMEANLK